MPMMLCWFSFDASGAFDGLSHQILLQKLHRAAPELNHYHVLLIPKDVDESTESDVSGSVRPPRIGLPRRDD